MTASEAHSIALKVNSPILNYIKRLAIEGKFSTIVKRLTSDERDTLLAHGYRLRESIPGGGYHSFTIVEW